ncbi:MAG TPA: sugar ABC transporter substrate-binding protein [Syntrophomonas sp.]|nr:sugar ABC transporter substrate-binding protein [Syntrophomonas sp.]
MKKVVALVLALLLSVSFAACSNTQNETTGENTTDGAGSFTYQKLYEYPAVQPIKSQAPMDNLHYVQGEVPVIAFMPAGTEYPYIMAVGEGIKTAADKFGAKVVTLAPESGADINGQVGKLQDAITMGVDVILINPHDDSAAAPLIQQALDAGIAVFNLNSDSTDFVCPLTGVVGYAQKKGNIEQAKMITEKFKDKKLVIGIIEGLPGYHNDQRTGGFKEGIASHPDYEIVASVNGSWNTDGGNTAAMDMLQAHPDINLIYAANDMEAMGALTACKTLGRTDVIICANDGNTEYLEAIYDGSVYSTLNTVPYEMGLVACQAAIDALYGEFQGGWVESPGYVATKENVLSFLQKPETLMPRPSKEY